MGGSDLAETERNAVGIAIHAGLGMAPGALYPALRRRLPCLRAGRRTVYGLALFVVTDEVAGRLLGIMGPQRNYPWRTHLRGLLGHVVLGVVTEMTLNVLEEQSSSQYEPREHQGEATGEQRPDSTPAQQLAAAPPESPRQLVGLLGQLDEKIIDKILNATRRNRNSRSHVEAQALVEVVAHLRLAADHHDVVGQHAGRTGQAQDP